MDNLKDTTTDMKEPVGRKGVYGSTLKLIATMLVDHTAATILERLLAARRLSDAVTGSAMIPYDSLYLTYMIMRLIGRIAFPIFCFLLVEGFVHTRSKWKYTLRLAIFALVSEIPFDLALFGKPFYFGYQNVFFTLLIGMVVMIGFETISEKLKEKNWLPVISMAGIIAVGAAFTYFVLLIIKSINGIKINQDSIISIHLNITAKTIIAITFCIIVFFVYLIMGRKNTRQAVNIKFADLAVLVAGMFLSMVLVTDYSSFGVLTIAVIYGLRRNHLKAMLGGCITLTIMSFSEATAFLALIPAHLYNGKRGLKLKFIFYAFYPVHLFILYVICYFMNLV